MDDGIKGLPRHLGILSSDQVYFTRPAGAITSNAVVNIGGGHWEYPFVTRFDDVSGTQSFNTGISNGNILLGVNSEPGFSGYLLGIARGGAFVWSCDFGGVVSQASTNFAPRIAALWGTPVTPSIALAAGGSLVSGTTYFYKISAFDPRGNELNIYSAEVSATPSGGNLSIALTWSYGTSSNVPGVGWFRVYRTTTQGAYTNANYYIVFFPTFTFTDTGQAASGTATPAGSSTAANGYNITNTVTEPNRLPQLTLNSVNFGSALNLGSGPLDGSTTGKFVGSANGTVFAINANTGFVGNLFDFQNFGASKLSLDGLGNLTAATSFVDGVGTSPISRLDCYYNFT